MLDTQAFENAVDKGRSRLLRVANSILRQSDDAEEAVQTGLTLAWQKREQYNGGSIVSWLHTIVKRAALDELRRRKRVHDEDRVDLTPNLPSRLPDAYQQIVRTEQIRILCVALGSPKLLDIYRDAILEIINDEPFPEKCTSTLRVRRTRAIDAISVIIQSRINAVSRSSYRRPAYKREPIRCLI